MSENKDYKQVFIPDFSRIAEIILSAKGVERNMAQFSAVCGINTSTLSRLVNCKLKRPLGIDMIDAIMDNKSPSCTISKDELIRANGMVAGGSDAHRYRDDRQYDGMRIRQERTVRMSKILFDELFIRGVTLKKMDRNEVADTPVLKKIAAMKSGVLLKKPESVHESYWGLIMNPLMLDPKDDRDIDSKRSGEPLGLFRQRMLAYYASLFLTDAWEPELMTDIKCSFVFCDESYYNTFRRGLERAKIASNMTTILLDLKEGKVIKEEPAPGCKKHGQDQYFNIPVEEADGSAGDDNFQDEIYDFEL